MNKNKILVLFTSIVSLVAIYFYISGKVNLGVREDNIKDSGKIVSLDKMENLEATKDGYYYFGRPDCLDCRDFQKDLNNYLENNNIVVYYINTVHFRNNYASFEDFLSTEAIDRVPVIIQYIQDTEVNRIVDSNEISKILID